MKHNWVYIELVKLAIKHAEMTKRAPVTILEVYCALLEMQNTGDLTDELCKVMILLHEMHRNDMLLSNEDLTLFSLSP